MPMMQLSDADVQRARPRVLSADHVFFDADGTAVILPAGEPLLECAVTMRRSKVGGIVVETTVLAAPGSVLVQLWTIGKLVAWERA